VGRNVVVSHGNCMGLHERVTEFGDCFRQWHL
jgi:hypothetical protein